MSKPLAHCACGCTDCGASRSRPHAETVASTFHSLYEHLAPTFGYETRADSAVRWPDVPEQNRKLMIAVVEHLIAMGLIR